MDGTNGDILSAAFSIRLVHLGFQDFLTVINPGSVEGQYSQVFVNVKQGLQHILGLHLLPPASRLYTFHYGGSRFNIITELKSTPISQV